MTQPMHRSTGSGRQPPTATAFTGTAFVVLVLAVALGPRLDGQAPAQASRPAAAPCSISGTVAAGRVRLPGVIIVATPRDGGRPVTTSTGLDGAFIVGLPAPGVYDIKAELAAFAAPSREVTLGSPCQARVEIAMTLASRVQPAAGAAPVEKPQPVAQAPAQAARGPRGAAGQFQRVAAVPGAAGAQGQQQEVTTAAEDARALAEHLSLPPGFSAETLSDTVTAFGRTGQTNEVMLFAGRPEGMFGGPEGMAGIPGIPTLPGIDGQAATPGGAPGEGGRGGRGGMGPGGGGAAGFGGMGPGGMGPGGGRGGMGGQRGGGAGGLADRLAIANRIRQDRPQGQVSYTLGGSPLDAAPYSLNGQAREKPDYLQQRISGSIGGQFKIPGLFDLGQRTSYFFNYSGNHSSTLYSAYSTVPTEAQRAGDLSTSSTQLTDPATGQPFAGNQIPADRISPAARALLAYIPLPNQEGTRQNYYYTTTNTTSSDEISFRFVRTFGTVDRNRRGGAPGGGAPGGGAMGGRGGGGGARGGMNLNVSVSYRRQDGTQSTAFPFLHGTSRQTGWNVPVSFSFTRWGIVHSLRGGFNRNHTETTNAFAYLEDVAGLAGIKGVSTDPFDWGAPNLSFSSFSGLRDINPSVRTTQTVTFADTMMKMLRRHSLRWGFDYRDERIDSRSDSSPRGSYVFTGLYTSGGTARASGADFADFLLGLPQQASIQYGPGLVQLRAKAFNLFLQDDWRVRSNLTLNAGVRYEYQSPYTETGNRLVNLDVAPGFTAAAAVQAGQVGPYTGMFPTTVVEPDRNNIAPRIGIAWRPWQRTVLRGGYGITYSSVPYLSFAQRMSGQPPFATTDTRMGTVATPLVFTDAFGTPTQATTTNNYGVDRNYRIGYVHLWNADLQRDVGRTLSMGVSYTGTKGTSLDIQRAPNRGPSGLRIEGVQPFIWESSEGRSILHAVSVRLRKRLAQGLSAGGVYTYSTSRDNASTLGGGGGVVAQNDQDLEAEWGPSSFDVRHRFSGDFSLELPFGPGRRWLGGEGLAGKIIGGWMLNGTLTIQSGQPFTARVTGAVSDVASGVNGTLRADYNGEPTGLDDPTILQFFNTSAFSVPAAGTFGTAGRNTIIGPGSTSFNMSLMKNVPIRGTRGVSLRVQATNVFNVPQWGSIDTVVNSPTFGQVVSVRSMRSVQIVARVAF